MSVPQPPFLSYISPQYFSFPDTLDFPHLLTYYKGPKDESDGNQLFHPTKIRVS